MPSKTFINNLAKSVSLRIVIIMVVFLLSFAVFALILNEVIFEKENAFDTRVYDLVKHYIPQTLTGPFLFITFFGSNLFLLPAYIAVVSYFLFMKRKTRLSLDIIAIGVSSTAILFLMKRIFERARPQTSLIGKVNGFSFPSGHTFSSFVFFGMLIYILWQSQYNTWVKWVCSIVFFSMAFLIGFSRVYLHVHYPTDVIGGFCLSIIWLALSFWILRKLNYYPTAHWFEN